MNPKDAVGALAALAQETRLAAFRLLVEAGPAGLPATDIAERLGIRQNLMSTHLTVLANAGVTASRREGRRIFHALDFATVRRLLSFLVEDCCNGKPELCQRMLDDVMPICDCPEDRINIDTS